MLGTSGVPTVTWRQEWLDNGSEHSARQNCGDPGWHQLDRTRRLLLVQLGTVRLDSPPLPPSRWRGRLLGRWHCDDRSLVRLNRGSRGVARRGRKEKWRWRSTDHLVALRRSFRVGKRSINAGG